jgi:hypothetical protein
LHQHGTTRGHRGATSGHEHTDSVSRQLTNLLSRSFVRKTTKEEDYCVIIISRCVPFIPNRFIHSKQGRTEKIPCKTSTLQPQPDRSHVSPSRISKDGIHKRLAGSFRGARLRLRRPAIDFASESGLWRREACPK